MFWIIAIIVLFVLGSSASKGKKQTGTFKKENERLNIKLVKLEEEKQILNQKINEISEENNLFKVRLEAIEKLDELEEYIQFQFNKIDKLEKQEVTQKNKIKRIKNIYNSVAYAIDNFDKYDSMLKLDISEEQLSLIPEVTLKLHHMDVRTLNRLFKENYKQIEKILSQYEDRYTTKANKTIYHLMVLALQAELQNILYNLKYQKLDESIEKIKIITSKYFKLSENGNKTISNTLIKFIGQIEYLFINAVKIEYNYYVKKEQARQEQLAIKQQMREEAEERRLLKLEKERIENEEKKYKLEIEKMQETLEHTDNNDNREIINKKIEELQDKLSDVIVKKDDIIKLQNGKAGNIYIISNLGSFGENIFKIGMTRRIDPQDRINELGSASVPFKFDVHCFIFSEDAVFLEKELHKKLDEKRVNKVNLRKEFFYSNINEIEEIVYQMEPTAEFNKMMIAEEHTQTLSTDENYNTIEDDLDEDEMDEEEYEQLKSELNL